ncbi:MAG: YebC/PmpR family DNA-binding transcriptional regulator [Planctomycetes bacterium]|nr:YebC/PmpR family DNA-binding transcriptional regulator [Planctomycetota bacterium]
MAGHSHWKNIQHKKGAADAVKGRAWSKLSRQIMVAAKTGGSDPVTNAKLRVAIEDARAVSMPKDNIERAVKKGAGELEGVNYDEISYEGFGPGGVAIMLEILTDNRNRTNGAIRKIFEKGGGNMGAPGCVKHMFERKGLFEIPAKGVDEDTLMAIALDAGADDMKNLGDAFEVTCDPSAFAQVKAALEKNNITPTSASVTQIGKVPVDCDTETGQKVLRLLEALDEHDDVQKVYSNLNVTDAMTAS